MDFYITALFDFLAAVPPTGHFAVDKILAGHKELVLARYDAALHLYLWRLPTLHIDGDFFARRPGQWIFVLHTESNGP